MSRDGNGNYTPPLNPVVGGQPIEADWANDTINDLAAALTDSLSRSGNGNMLAAFRATDGTVTIPSIAFTNEPNSGLYRAGAGDYRLCVNGKDKARIRDVNGMPAFQVFDLAGTGAWETLATAADVSALTLADVLAVGNTTGGTNLQVSASDDLLLSDTSKLKFETDGSNYLQIYKAAGASGGSFIHEVGGGDLNVRGQNGYLQNDAGNALIAWDNELAELNWQGTTGTGTKIRTTATGVDVFGTVLITDPDPTLTLKDSSDADDHEINFRGSDDVDNLQITSTGNHLNFITADSNKNILMKPNGATVLQVDTTGIDVTGAVEADSFSGTGNVAITDFIDDDSFATASATNVPTAESVKAYVDTAGGNETLAQTLALGNSTGATDIEMTDSAKIISSNIITLEAPLISLKNSSGSPMVSTDLESVRLLWQTTGSVGARLDTTELGVDITGEMVANRIRLNSPNGSPSVTVAHPIIDLYNRNVSVSTGDAVIGLKIGPSNYKAKANATPAGTSGATYAFTQAKTVAVEEGAEEGKYEIWVKEAGVDVNVLQVNATGIDVTGSVAAGRYTTGATNGESSYFSRTNVDLTLSVMYVQRLEDDGKIASFRTGSVTPNLGDEVLGVLSTGIDVTGTVSTDTGLLVTTVSNEPALETTGELRLASSNTGSVSMGVNGTPNFYVNNSGFPSLGTGTTGGGAGNGLQVNDDNILCYKPLKFNAIATEISRFSIDGTFASPSDNELPTTQAVKTYVDNAAFPTTTNNAADIAYTAFNTFSGKRIINTASSTATTYGLPTPVTADVGKSWVICNPTDSEITIDHDASGTANYIWIMDGVTLSAAASSWTIKKGAIVEIVVVASDSGGGSATAPNYLIFGAGLLEIV